MLLGLLSRDSHNSPQLTFAKRLFSKKMPKFVIERSLPNAGSMSVADLEGISAKSCGVS